MAIAFNCPHCQLAYRLSEKLAGKQAKCKNPECRKVITIPTPVTVPDDAPHRTEEEREAAALAALSDEAPKPTDAPPQEKVIPMTCEYCGHQWAEAWAKGGKNTLCPNPECRQRMKVPEPKEDIPQDWRHQKTNLPSLAKKNFEKLEGVQDAEDVKIVSGQALREADATGEEIEPRPLKDKVFIGLTVAALVGGCVFGVWYLMQSRTESKEEALMADALKNYGDVSKTMEKADAGLSAAVLHVADSEYALMDNTKDETKKAHEAFVKARDAVRHHPPGLGRNAVAAELALAVLNFGGTEEQAREEVRYRWEPDAAAARVARINQRPRTIHEELRQTASLLPLTPADFDFRVATARRLVRDLAKRGRAGFAADILPLAMFTDAERDEARAVVALEIHRAEPGSPHARKLADELKAGAAGFAKSNPYPASAQTLFAVLGVPTDKPVVPPPGAKGSVASEPAVLAYAGVHLLKDEAGAALELAKRAVSPATQLKAFVLCAEWAADPGPALDAAAQLVAAEKAKKGGPAPSQALILRLSHLAAAAGKYDLAKAFSDALADEGARAWARGDAARLRVAANPKEKADEAWVEVPDDAKKQKAGHGWGRMWVARQNTRLSGNRDAEKKAVNGWPTAAVPFGLAGVALGLKDRQ